MHAFFYLLLAACFGVVIFGFLRANTQLKELRQQRYGAFELTSAIRVHEGYVVFDATHRKLAFIGATVLVYNGERKFCGFQRSLHCFLCSYDQISKIVPGAGWVHFHFHTEIPRGNLEKSVQVQDDVGLIEEIAKEIPEKLVNVTP